MDTPLTQLLASAMLRDQPALRQRWESALRLTGPRRLSELAALRHAAQLSATLREKRERDRPKITYPEQLPVSAKRDEIIATLRDHQVIVVCGETGSGKTTQLPKICLDMGRGIQGMIGHTQPRRIAARAVAARIAEELHTKVGPHGPVTFKIRFSDNVSERTLIKLMTDGILLAETQSDRLLQQYDTLIIDEAHERSLNVDFLMGYLKQLLPQRPDLKIIITSATIDPESFSRHFHGCPIIMVSGRTYPVEVRYRDPLAPPTAQGTPHGNAGPTQSVNDAPASAPRTPHGNAGPTFPPQAAPASAPDLDEEEPDLLQAIVDAAAELATHGPGDILIFLSGEREIRETTTALDDHFGNKRGGVELLPLYARLSAEEQQRVFAPAKKRRIVLATNVAETSLTVPGIRYVIDPGLARISRYNPRSKVQRLPVEPVSQASANQRMGRCGRVAAGICIRLYSEEDFLARPVFTEPEILRTNLAAVILQMKALRLGAIEDFPFLEKPNFRLIADGYQTLIELGAMDKDLALTPLGEQLARLPIDPRIARMILAGQDEGVEKEVLIIAAALSVQDPRERPLDKQDAADAAHLEFRDEHSDFLSYLKLWNWYHKHAGQLSTNKLRRTCQAKFLSFTRMREWHDIHEQLTELLAEIRPPRPHPPRSHAPHKAQHAPPKMQDSQSSPQKRPNRPRPLAP